MFGWRKRDALDWRLSSNDLSTSFQLFVHLIRISFTSVCPFSYMCYVFLFFLFVHFLAGISYFFHVCLSVFLHVLRISFPSVCPFDSIYFFFKLFLVCPSFSIFFLLSNYLCTFDIIFFFPYLLLIMFFLLFLSFYLFLLLCEISLLCFYYVFHSRSSLYFVLILFSLLFLTLC